LNQVYYAERRADEVVARALAWMKDRQDERLFVWVHVFDCHAPYDPPSPYRERYAGRLYDGEIAYTDEALAPLLQAFDAPDGVTLLTADHGEGLGEHGEMTHSLFVYDSTARVPLLIRAPGVPPGTRVEAQVRTADIAPTLLELAGLEPRGDLDGRSLLPYVRGEETASRGAYGESFGPFFNFNWAKLRSLRDDRYKFIDAPRPELFDLESDPKEERNLWAEDPPAVARELVRELERIAALDEEKAEETEALDEETARRLESLGYVASSASIPESSDLPDPKDRVEVFTRLQSILAQTDWSPDRLLAEYRDILRLAPENAWARIRVANLLADEKRYQEAIVEFRLLTRGNALEARIQEPQVALLLLDRVEEALEVTQRAVEERVGIPTSTSFAVKRSSARIG
jgi:tetratricopeptide (TPR) repeat protein